MLDLERYKKAIEDKIRFLEASNSSSVLDREIYALNVGHRRGLLDALEILKETLVEHDEQGDEDGENNEDAG